MSEHPVILASPVLTWVIALPAIGATLSLFLPAGKTRIIRNTGLLFTLLTLVLAIIASYLFNWNDSDSQTAQLVHSIPWLSIVSSHYTVGVDSLSLPLVLLASSLGVIACFASRSILKQVKGFYILLQLALALALGAFIAQDLLLFYMFLQLAMIPLYFLIGLWGGEKKEFAAGKFALFMVTSAIILLIAILALHSFAQTVTISETPDVHSLAAHPFDIPALTSNRVLAGCFMPRDTVEHFYGPNTLLASDGSGVLLAGLIFWLFFVGFAILIPVTGLHTWLIDTVAEAPTSVAMLVSGLTVTLGGYGLFRIVYPIFPHQVGQFWWWIALIAIVTILYGALCALAQNDFRRLVAHASMSQMGFVILGFAMLTPAAVHGALFMLIAHAVNIALLLFVAGIIDERAHHRDIDRLGGLATQMPGFSVFAAVGFFAAMGIPGFCTFVGQLLVLLGSFAAAGIDPAESPLAQTAGHNTQFSVMVFTILATASSILTAGYLIWALQRIFLGPPRPEHHHFPALQRYEIIVLFILAAATLVLGIYPAPLLSHLPQFTHTLPHHTGAE
jgi:NADH-quinone oxidoreductase subunit M